MIGPETLFAGHGKKTTKKAVLPLGEPLFYQVSYKTLNFFKIFTFRTDFDKLTCPKMLDYVCDYVKR